MLQSVFSVFIVYRHKTLTGSPDPMHANCMDTPCITSTSKESESIEMAKGQFSEEHFTPILSSDEEDYDDYTDKDVEEFPELDYIDEQLHEAMSKLSKPDYEQYVQLRDQYLHQYRVTGRIQTFFRI